MSERSRQYRDESTCRKIAFAAAALVLFLSPERFLGQPPSQALACDVQSGLKQADELLKQKNYEAAQVALAKLSNCQKLTPLETFNIGWFYGRAHNFEKALAIIKTVSRDVPDLQTHQYAVGLGQFELGEYRAAAGTIESLETQGELNADASNLLGVSYSKLGDYQKAYAVFTGEIGRAPSDLFAYLNLITLLADAGKFADAGNVASRVVVAFPGNPNVLVARGASYTLMGEMSKAREDFAAAVRIAPDRSSARFLLALSDYKQGDYAKSEAELKTAIQAGVVDSDIHYLLAECLLKLNPTKPQAAIAELDRAISLNSASVSARTLRGKLLLEEDRPKDADIDLQLAHKVDPDSRSATYNLARVDMALGKQEEAKQLYSQMTKQPVDGVGELADRKLKQILDSGTAQ